MKGSNGIAIIVITGRLFALDDRLSSFYDLHDLFIIWTVLAYVMDNFHEVGVFP